MRARTWSFCGVLVVALVLAAPVQGQDDAPRVDPDSPAGTEYELPLDRAREEASGGGGTSGAAAAAAPLFGEGIEPTASSSGKGARSGARSTGTAAPVPEEGHTADSSTATVRAQAPQPGGGLGGALAIGGGAAAVLALGALGGLALRRRARNTS
jgi:hypothetical protein